MKRKNILTQRHTKSSAKECKMKAASPSVILSGKQVFLLKNWLNGAIKISLRVGIINTECDKKWKEKMKEIYQGDCQL